MYYFKFLIAAAVLTAVTALSVMAFSAEPQERPRCENCGMFTDISATTTLATLKVDGKAAEHNFVCLDCILEYNEREFDGKGELTALKVTDYPTFGTKSVQMIDGMTAWYLYGTKAIKGSMEPYIAAFKTKDAAVAAQKTIGGDLLDFKATWAKLTSGDEEEGSEHEHGTASAGAVYVCGCTGGCCDDIRADAPGSCPKCGMELVLKQ